MIRLLLLWLFGAGFCSAAIAIPPDYRFQVYLDGNEIGSHRFTFNPLEGDAGGYQLVSEAEYRVKVLFVTVYAYRHRSVETWRDGCLVAIRSVTDDNGETYRVTGEYTGAGLELDLNGSPQTVREDCIRTFAYWQPDALNTDQLLNSQTGEFEAVALEKIGESALPWRNDKLSAAALALDTEDGRIQLWYSEKAIWLGLKSTLANGRVLEYRAEGYADNPKSGGVKP